MGKVCTFFGHRDAPDSVRPALHKVMTELVEKQDVDTFYVGQEGRFDAMVRAEWKVLAAAYPHVRCTVVLACLPTVLTESDIATCYPEELENVPPRFTVDRRNRLMVEWADVVVTYVGGPGGAAKFRALAQKKGRLVIDLFE